MSKRPLAAAVAAAVIAVAAVGGTASTAQAGHGIHIKVKPFHKKHVWPHHGYGYGYGCFYKPKKVWTPWGPEWVSKKVCPWY